MPVVHFPDPIAALPAAPAGVPVEHLARRLGLASTQLAQLASNENPLGASPRALQALAAATIDLARYPDNDCVELVQALAKHLDVPPEWIIVGPGSENVIGLVVRMMLCPGRSAVLPQHAFQAFVSHAAQSGARLVEVPARDFTADLEAMAQHVARTPDAALVYLANPGNPTGTHVPPAQVEAFLQRVPAHVAVLLDEAYHEYLPAGLRSPGVDWVRRHPNLVLTRTFSKAYGLAGLRVGYGIAQPLLADRLRRVRLPFTVTTPAQIAATAALADEAFLRETVRTNEAGLHQLTQGLQALGHRVVPSVANFVLTEVGDAAGICQALEKRGILVRRVGNYGLPTWLRISVGLPQENQRLLQALREMRAQPT